MDQKLLNHYVKNLHVDPNPPSSIGVAFKLVFYMFFSVKRFKRLVEDTCGVSFEDIQDASELVHADDIVKWRSKDPPNPRRGAGVYRLRG